MISPQIQPMRRPHYPASANQRAAQVDPIVEGGGPALARPECSLLLFTTVSVAGLLSTLAAKSHYQTI